MRRNIATTLTLCALALTSLGAGSYSEADLKAALILRIAKYVEWPGEPSSQEICVGVLGTNVLSGEAHQAIEARTLHGREVYLRTSLDSSELTDCPIVFVSNAAVAPDFRNRPILTMGDSPGFARQGGIIEMVKERGRIGFIVNRSSAERAGLRVSSKLLRIAIEVY